jgi:hypothetical protein
LRSGGFVLADSQFVPSRPAASGFTSSRKAVQVKTPGREREAAAKHGFAFRRARPDDGVSSLDPSRLAITLHATDLPKTARTLLANGQAHITTMVQVELRHPLHPRRNSGRVRVVRAPAATDSPRPSVACPLEFFCPSGHVVREVELSGELGRCRRNRAPARSCPGHEEISHEP